MPNGDNQKASALRQFFSNPTVGVVGSIASIIGLVLAIYFYVQGAHYRDLVYFVHPAKAVVVKTGQLSRLSMTLDGTTLNTDVTAAQIAFWNEGNDAIRNEHMLQPFILVTAPQARIFEATVRKKSREAVRIDLDRTRIDRGELGLSWNILERGDGAIVQIIFAGPPSTPISAKAVIEGQRTLRKVEPWPGEPSGDRYSGRSRSLRLLVLAYVVGGIVFTGLGAWVLVGRRRRGAPIETFRLAIFLFFPAGFIFAGVLMAIFLRQPEPPFGF